MRFNIFRNPFIDVQARFLLDRHQEALQNQTEPYWRKTIADEIYTSCPSAKVGGYPCEPCYEMFEFVLYGHETSHE